MLSYDTLGTQRVLAEVAAERVHQVRVKRHSLEEDDARLENELCRMASCLALETTEVYAAPRRTVRNDTFYAAFPVLAPVCPPGDLHNRSHAIGWLALEITPRPSFEVRRRQLVMAAALITAEIERLDRAEAQRLEDLRIANLAAQAEAAQAAAQAERVGP